MSARYSQNRHPRKEREAAMLTTGDVANIFGVNPATILRWCRQGKIRTCGTGSHGKRLFRRSDVAAAYLERSIRRSLKNL